MSQVSPGAQLEACVAACRSCAEECERHCGAEAWSIAACVPNGAGLVSRPARSCSRASQCSRRSRRIYGDGTAERSADGSAIRLRGFVKRFGALTAVDGLDLDVPYGTCVGLLGPERRRASRRR